MPAPPAHSLRALLQHRIDRRGRFVKGPTREVAQAREEKKGASRHASASKERNRPLQGGSKGPSSRWLPPQDPSEPPLSGVESCRPAVLFRLGPSELPWTQPHRVSETEAPLPAPNAQTATGATSPDTPQRALEGLA